jgi:hypothetical protein
LFACGVGWRHLGFCFVLTDSLSNAESFREHMDERSVNIVDAASKLGELMVAHQ